MLVLGRRLNETIRINDNIEVTVLEINRGQVKIGINAPKEVKILRSELIERDQEVEKAS